MVKGPVLRFGSRRFKSFEAHEVPPRMGPERPASEARNTPVCGRGMDRQREMAKVATRRSHKPLGAGSTPALATRWRSRPGTRASSLNGWQARSRVMAGDRRRTGVLSGLKNEASATRLLHFTFPGSSNGRTPRSGRGNRGSSPWPGALCGRATCDPAGWRSRLDRAEPGERSADAAEHTGTA